MLQNAPREDKTLAGLGWHGVAAESPTAKFDLTLLLHETPRGLLSSVEFAADLWEASTVRRMLGHLQVLLEGVAERPERALLDLPLMPPAERDQALLDWNRTGVEYPRDATVDALFEAEVDRAPEAIAVVFGESCLSYRAAV